MKKLLFLLPAVIGGLLLTGCVDEVVVDRPGPRPAYYGDDYYGDPYYVYGGTNYYHTGGRYYYYRNRQRYFVSDLPGGGVYFHAEHPHRRYYRGRWY
jgi:hypothetical protein